MKYNIAAIVMVLFGALSVAARYVERQHQQQRATDLRQSVLQLTLQQLAGKRIECDPPPWNGDRKFRHTAFCVEVVRALESGSLQVVLIPQLTLTPFDTLPSPRPRLQRVVPLEPVLPSLPLPLNPLIFDSGSVSST